MMERMIVMRRMVLTLAVLTLAAPMLLLSACAEVDSEPVNELVVDTDGATAQVRALYQAGGDVILVRSRRIVTELSEADGLRSEWYHEVDASASEYEVEVKVIDPQRGIELLARGDNVSLESDGASPADQEHAMALFGEATLALAASDTAIPVAERRVLDQLGDQATNPGAEAPPILTPLSTDQGCWGENKPPRVEGTALIAESTAFCISKGYRQFSLCVRVAEVGGGTPEGQVGSFVDRLWNDFFGSDPHVHDWIEQVELGCHESGKEHFDPPTGGVESFDIKLDRFCSPDGEKGKRWEYEPHLRSVTDFSPWWTFGVEVGREEWHTLEQGPKGQGDCGVDDSEYSDDPEITPVSGSRAKTVPSWGPV